MNFSTPPDLPDDVPNAVPIFMSRRKAAQLPPLRPAPSSNAFDQGWCPSLARADWHRGFRWGVLATVGGLCVMVALLWGQA